MAAEQQRQGARLGVIYGALLSALCFLLAGGGHGPYVLLGWCSAPLSTLGAGVGLLGMPVMWGMIARLAYSETQRNRRLFLGAMAVHYISAILVWKWPTSDFADGDYFHKVAEVAPALLYGTIALYLIGQIWLVSMFVLNRTPQKNT